jgi:hypothetical protein
MFKKFLILLFFFVFLSSPAFAPPPTKKPTIRVDSINSTLVEQGKSIICYADEEETISFKLSIVIRGSVDNSIPIKASALPAGSTYVNNIFRWIPNENQSGDYEINFSAKARRAKLKQKVNISVSNNILSIQFRDTYTKVFKAVDPDGDVVKIMVVGPPEGSTVSSSSDQRTFTWTPTINQIGIHKFTIIAIDMPKDENGNLIQIIQKSDVRYMKITVNANVSRTDRRPKRRIVDKRK